MPHVTQGEDDPKKVGECLKYAGIRELRDDGSTNPQTLAAFIELHKSCGAKIDALPITGDIAASLREYETLAEAGALLSVEGPNEPNNFKVSYEGRRSSAKTSMPIARFQRDLYAAVKADAKLKGIPVFHSSEAGGSEPDNCGLQFLTIPANAGTLMPDGTQYADYANTHNYVCGHGLSGITEDNIAWNAEDPILNGQWDGLFVEYGHTWWGRGFDGYSKEQLEKLPRVTTETGWNTRPAGGGNATSIGEEQQGKLFLNLCLDTARRGWSYTFIYMLRDSKVQGYWGLFNVDYTPKPSAVFLHNLTTILGDTSSDSAAAEVQYSIDEQPPTVHDLLLQKRDGTFDLAIGAEKAKGSENVTVHLSSADGLINVYDPTVGTTPVKSLQGGAPINLMMSDHPLIVEFRKRS